MQKRLEYGFSGYQGPPIPRATRSVRRRSVIPKKKGDEKNQMCAFDLLATVAGKLLLESDSSNSSADTSNNIIKEKSPLKNCFNKEDYNNVDSELISQPPPVININNNSTNKEARHGHDACSGPTASVITTSDSSVMVDSSRENKSVPLNNGAGNRNSVKFPLCKDHIPCGSNVKLGIKDDDENCSTGNKSALRPLVCKIDRRIRKSMASDLTIKDNTDLEDRKSGYKRERSIRDYPFKKRRLYGGFNNNYDNIDNHDEGICVSPGEAFSVKDSNTKDALFGPSPSPAPQSEESHVKLKIKSFRVPEFSVEMLETASVASLKRKVMETVTAIIGGGPHVGVVVQGKKIRDDSKTLLQTGITHNHKLDSLAFILEPNSNTSSQPSPPHHTPQPLPRAINNDMLPDQTGTNLSNLVESDHDSASSPPDPDMSSQEKSGADLRALVPVTSMNAEALQMVPMRKSTKRSESAQRRIRRPFSVSEVEALVQAVEKLGTGRWRDVKLRAFDNAKHRTYVDLKDKWKTLVHTARISPQQRRGEPVPQELLDRVLLAHAYWSQQQAKQQFKQHSEACLLL